MAGTSTRRGLSSPLFLSATDMDEVEPHGVCGGTACIFTRKAPDRERPNQDSLALIPVSEDRAVLCVADGMGGMPGGGRASQVAIAALVKALADAEEGESLRPAILDGIESANQAILADETGGGTTLAVVELFGRKARPYHVGDSLILVTGQRGRIKAQAVPHSPVGYAFESGLIDEWEAMVHEERHIVDNMVGSETMRIEIGPELVLAARDTLLIASDGLFDNLFQSEIVELIRKGNQERAARETVRICSERMVGTREGEPSKPDDLTVITYRVT